jgi:hypothetical protein
MIMLDPPTLSVWERDTWNLETPKKMDFSVLSDIASSVSYCSTFLVRDYLRFYGRQTNNILQLQNLYKLIVVFMSILELKVWLNLIIQNRLIK